MAADGSQQPEDFPYIQLWASADGETHIQEFKAKGFDLKKYASVRVIVASINYCEDQCTRLQRLANSHVFAWQKRCLPPAHSAKQQMSTASCDQHASRVRLPNRHTPCVVQGEQLVKEFSKPLKVIFTELAVGLENDYHCCPQVQLVITLKGSW